MGSLASDAMQSTQYYCSPWSLVLPAAAAMVLGWLWWVWRPPRRLPLPPGPPKLPIVGNMLIMDKLTHRGLADLARRYGGLLHLRLGLNNHTVVVSSPAMARHVLQLHDHLFSNRPATAAISYLTYDRSDMAFANYGPFWRQMRKLCVLKLFSRKRAAASWAAVRDEVDAAVRAVALSPPGSTVNVGDLVFDLTKNIIYRAAFGSSSHEGQRRFVSILQEFSRLFGALNVADFVPALGRWDLQGINRRLVKARRDLDGFIDQIIDDHLARPKPSGDPDADMVDEMLAFLPGAAAAGASDELHQASFTLTRENIKAIIMDVMFGGTETVASAIEWAMAELMRSPEDMKKVQQELAAAAGLDRKVREDDLDGLPFFRCCVKETLRLHPPIPLLLHEAADVDCEVAGYRVPARARVMVNAWAIGRDPSAWKDADCFRPSRFAVGCPTAAAAAAPDFRGGHFEFIPFGSGRRSCPGMQLGIYGLELAAAQLLHCFTWELPDGMKPGELDMSDVFGLTAPRAVRLAAVPTPRLTCSLV